MKLLIATIALQALFCFGEARYEEMDNNDGTITYTDIHVSLDNQKTYLPIFNGKNYNKSQYDIFCEYTGNDKSIYAFREVTDFKENAPEAKRYFSFAKNDNGINIQIYTSNGLDKYVSKIVCIKKDAKLIEGLNYTESN